MTDTREDRKIPLPRVLDNLPRPPEAFSPPHERSRLALIEQELSRTPLEEIAGRLAKLTYGEMKELSQGIKAENDAIWDWAIGYIAKDMK